MTLKVPVLAGPALWRGQEDETQACNGRHVESGCSRAVMNEPVKDMFEDKSEQQCSVQKCGQTLLYVNIRASSWARMSRS